jgi:phosphopantothenoylcysteine decarboxylase/phosphopantothenate--cysteine ligase
VARILVGVTGGIAAYKACTLVRLLVRAGHDVYPLVTAAAARFVSPETFFALARKSQSADPYPHLERADLLVVAPLTANTLARLAHGLADDLLTEAALAHAGPVVVAPAMNVRMWEHAATQANAETLRRRGVRFVGPVEGELAEGEVGAGRMAEPEQIAEEVERLLGPDPERGAGSLAGLRVLVSAGGTREQLDAVRFLGNRSSGRMGVAVAEEARRRGADVTLLAANLAVPAPAGVTVVATPTAADLEREALARSDADVIVMAAAVADYRPAAPEATKRPKDDAPWTVELVPTTDVLAALGDTRCDGQVLVGFAADGAGAGLERAREKRAAKNADLIVFNDVTRSDIGFDAADNEVVLLSNGSETRVEKAPKPVIAAAVVDEIERILDRQPGGR